jgi:galactose mutarotase-like enzyme
VSWRHIEYDIVVLPRILLAIDVRRPAAARNVSPDGDRHRSAASRAGRRAAVRPIIADMQIDELTLEQGRVSARVAPAHGAIVTGVTVGGRELLFMDRSTLTDPAKSVRGGIPLLFPFAGRLDGDRLVHAGTTMKQHGFARNKPWQVAERRAEVLHLALEDDAETRAAYPHAFRVDYVITLLPAGIELELRIHNRGTTPMPVAPGWHPYFPCPSAAKPRVRPNDVPQLDAGRFTPDAEFDFGVTAPAAGRATFDIPELGVLSLGFAPELRFLQCWGLPGRDFICLEPFLGPNNTINTDARLDVPAGESRRLWMRAELLRA